MSTDPTLNEDLIPESAPDAAEEREFLTAPPGRYGAEFNARLVELKPATMNTKNGPYHYMDGLVTFFTEGEGKQFARFQAFGDHNTGTGSQSGSSWPRFQQQLGLVTGQSIAAQLGDEGLPVIVDVIHEHFTTKKEKAKAEAEGREPKEATGLRISNVFRA